MTVLQPVSLLVACCLWLGGGGPRHLQAGAPLHLLLRPLLTRWRLPLQTAVAAFSAVQLQMLRPPAQMFPPTDAGSAGFPCVSISLFFTCPLTPLQAGLASDLLLHSPDLHAASC